MAKKIVIILIGFLFFQQSFAAHIKGGWMYYEYQGVSPTNSAKYRYKLVLKVYRDCNTPTPNQNDATAKVTFFRNADNSRADSVDIPLINIYPLNKVSFSDCLNPKPTICYNVLNYEGFIDLTPIAQGYIGSYQRCCRISGIVNIQAPSNNAGNTYTITIPGTANNINDPKNSSPKFAEKDTVVVCFNSNIQLDYSATDTTLENDSLVYSFAPALTGADATNPIPVSSVAPPYSSINYQAPYTFADPFNTGIQINPQTGIITGRSPAQTGEYVVAVRIREYRNGVMIAETRKELHVTVNACALSSAFLGPKPVTCNGFDVTFENEALGSIPNTYFWDFGVTNRTDDTSNLPVPVYRYQDTGVYIAKLVINKYGQCSDSATRVVRVYPGFFPGFAYIGACKGVAFQFRDTTRTNYGSVNSWKWYFGDETTVADSSAGSPTPSWTYPSAGVKPVQLIVTNSKGCVDTALVNITVLDKPVLTLPFHDTLICSIDTLQLRANGMGNFSWTPPYRLINPDSANPYVYPLVTTVYHVLLNDRGCLANDSIKVNVLDFITVDAGADTTICLTDRLTLRPVSQALNYLWTPAATLSNATVKNPVATPLATTTIYRVTANLGKCQDKDSVIVKTVPYPKANAGPDTTICFTGTAVLTAVVSGNNYSWSPASLVASPRSLTTTATPRTSTLFVLTVTDTLGCPKPFRDSVLVNVIPKVVVFAGNDTSIVISQPLVFQASASSFATLYRWTPATGISDPTLLRPTVTITSAMAPVGTDQFLYTLRATSPEGCEASDDIVLKVFRTGPSIFVPSAFTPNADGKNDGIKPILVGMQRLDFFKVYNRYGQLVFQTSEIDRDWDGRLKGELQNSAAFVYYAQAVDYNGKTVKAKGTFVLIR